MWRQIRQLFSNEEQAEAQDVAHVAVAPPPAETASGQQGFLDDEAVKSQIETMLAQRPPESDLLGGKVNLLNLAAIKDRLGVKWPRYEEQVHAFVAKTLERRLSEQDFFTRSGEGSYLILFHEASQTEAKLKCALLGQEIATQFFGQMEDDETEGLQLETVLATVDGKVARQSVSLADAIGAALAEAEAEAAVSGSTRAADPMVAKMMDILGAAEARFAELNKRGAPRSPKLMQSHFHELIRQLRNIEAALAAETQRWERLPGSGNGWGELSWEGQQATGAELLRKFIERADRAIQESEPCADADGGDEGPLLGLETSYLPLWSVKHESIGLYRCQTHVVMHDAEVGADLDPDDEKAAQINDAVDRITLRRARADLQRLSQSGLSCLVVVPVSFETLDRPASAQRYLPLCHAVPKELRQMIVWEITDAPPTRWTADFTRIVAQLKPLGRVVFVLSRLGELPLASLDRVFAKLKSIGVQGAGLDLTGHAVSEVQIMQYLDRFAEAAEKQMLTTYLDGVASLSLSTAASCTGIEHLSGDVVADAVERPEGVQHKELASLYFPPAVAPAL